MRPVVRKEEEGEMGADRADESAGRGVVGLKTCHVDGGNGKKARPEGLVRMSSLATITTRQNKTSKQSTQLNRACLCPLVLLCGPGFVAATEPPALLCLLAPSVDLRSDLLCSGLRSLSLVRVWIHPLPDEHFQVSIPLNEQKNNTIHDNINTYKHDNTTQPNPQPALSIVQPLRALSPSHLQPPHHDKIGTNQHSCLPPPSKRNTQSRTLLNNLSHEPHRPRPRLSSSEGFVAATAWLDVCCSWD